MLALPFSPAAPKLWWCRAAIRRIDTTYGCFNANITFDSNLPPVCINRTISDHITCPNCTTLLHPLLFFVLCLADGQCGGVVVLRPNWPVVIAIMAVFGVACVGPSLPFFIAEFLYWLRPPSSAAENQPLLNNSSG